jgi:hypothetical protein
LKTFPFFLLLLSFSSLVCKQPSTNCRPSQNADFYYWKTNFRLSPKAYTTLQEHGTERLYIRCFDLTLEVNEAVPNAPITFSDRIPERIEGIPVIYIANDVWKTPQNTGLLTEKTLQLIHKLWPNGTSKPITEIQIDCDWSPSTRVQFFAFLTELKSQLAGHCTLSATIRLHQFQRPDLTGVPPVHHGMLMLYNTGTVTSFDEKNSILTAENAEIWLKTAKPYPIPLHVALPDFRWAVVFRLGEFHHIMHNQGPESLNDTALFQQTNTSRYTCQQNTLLDGYYLHRGDEIRLEAADTGVVKSVLARFIAQNKAEPCRKVWYHLNE